MLKEIPSNQDSSPMMLEQENHQPAHQLFYEFACVKLLGFLHQAALSETNDYDPTKAAQALQTHQQKLEQLLTQHHLDEQQVFSLITEHYFKGKPVTEISVKDQFIVYEAIKKHFANTAVPSASQ